MRCVRHAPCRKGLRAETVGYLTTPGFLAVYIPVAGLLGALLLIGLAAGLITSLAAIINGSSAL